MKGFHGHPAWNRSIWRATVSDIGIAWTRFGSKDPDYELEILGDGREAVNPVRRLYLRIKHATRASMLRRVASRGLRLKDHDRL
jgi:hypothetical protein